MGLPPPSPLIATVAGCGFLSPPHLPSKTVEQKGPRTSPLDCEFKKKSSSPLGIIFPAVPRNSLSLSSWKLFRRFEITPTASHYQILLARIESNFCSSSKHDLRTLPPPPPKEFVRETVCELPTSPSKSAFSFAGSFKAHCGTQPF